MSLLATLPKIEGKYIENAPIGSLSSFGIGGKAEILFLPKDANDLSKFIKSKKGNIPVHCIGRATNTLIRDGGIQGVVIQLKNSFDYYKIIKIKNNKIIFTVGTGITTPKLADFALKEGIGGLEFLCCIPGSLGGALAMNAGAHGNDIFDFLISVTGIHKIHGEIKTFPVKEILYGYRKCHLTKDWIFTEAKLFGHPATQDEIKKSMQRIKKQRLKTQPIGRRSCGSVFKNPSNRSAWRLISETGCQGLMVGGAKVSDKHCNFIINEQATNAAEIENLIGLIKNKVFICHNIELEEEIIIIGEKNPLP